MEKESTYLTLKGQSEGLYKEKGSKFIGIAVPCQSEEEAKKYVDAWRKEHYQARHVCYAYILGRDKSRYRANDDGEPNNSAGPPILGQIRAFDLTNVLIGVVRYYGGTKLGVGGLINAYKTAAQEAIESGKIIEKEVFRWFELKFEYDAMPQVMQLLKMHKLEMEENDFALSCRLKVKLSFDQVSSFLEELKLLNVELIDLGTY